MARNSLQKHKTADKIKWIVTLIVVLALIGSVVTLFVKLDRQTSTTTIGGEAYSIGTIDETGEYAEGNTAIYLRKAITTDGLKCELSKNAEITYQLFFYDKDGAFLSASETLSADFDGTVPEGAESVKIMITPTADEDGKVSVVEVLGYANQLKVTVKK
ncbi:MAG: hypothetical protein ACI4ST_05835 [Candidatus Gallimonas sp.]